MNPARRGFRRRFHFRTTLAAALAAAASVFVALAGLLVARFDGLATFGEFVTLQSIGVLLAIPMLWGVHVNASRAMSRHPDGGAVCGTALAVTAMACLGTAVAFALGLSLLATAGPVSRSLWHAAPFGASMALVTLTESMLRVRGRNVAASTLKLAWATGYLVAVVAVLTTGAHGSAVLYTELVTAGNLGCAASMLVGPLRPRLRWDRGLAVDLVREGRLFFVSQSLLTLLFGFDLLLLAHARGAQTVAVYALYVSGSRRVLGVLFSDSLASLLIASLSREESPAGRRIAGRVAPWILAGSGVGSVVLTLASLMLAGALDRLVPWWLVAAALGCAAHALVIVLFCVFTIHPPLGLARIRTLLAWTIGPGLGLQWLAAGAGVPGMITTFAVLNLGLAWTMRSMIRPESATQVTAQTR